VTATKLLLIDCDSTLSSIEGIDELARVRSPEVFKEVETLTTEAMDGKIPIASVFGRRLEIIRPRREDAAAIGERYLFTIEPSAKATLETLRSRGWTPVIISGGFRNSIRPLADHLGIERVEAVDLFFEESGAYTGYDEAFPTTRNGGKPEIVRDLRDELQPTKIVMVGDGASDLEAKPECDQFIGFGRYVAREVVKKGADHFITSFDELLRLLD
jgi:phosphoserine phosphatase